MAKYVFGALLGDLGAVLGLSWAPLGTLLGHLGAISRPRKAIGQRKGEKAKINDFTRFLKDFGLSLSSLVGIREA